MSEQKHTSGPWRANGVRVDADCGLVALVYSCGDGPLYENARLIAAAPELLDLAEGVVTAYGDKLLPTPTEKHLLDGARAALAALRNGGEA